MLCCVVSCCVTDLLIFVYVHTHKNIHIISTCRSVYMLIHTYVHKRMYSHPHTYSNAYSNTYMYTYIHIHTYTFCTYIRTLIHMFCTYTQAGRRIVIREDQIEIISDTSSPTGIKVKLVFKITMPADGTYVRLCVLEKGRMCVCVSVRMSE